MIWFYRNDFKQTISNKYVRIWLLKIARPVLWQSFSRDVPLTTPFVSTQPARSVPEIFGECSLSVAIFRTSREHLGNTLKEKLSSKVLDGKVAFALKVYDLIITNVDLLGNSSNHKVMFPEYSRDIPQMPVSKIFQGYPRSIVKLWKYC